MGKGIFTIEVDEPKFLPYAPSHISTNFSSTDSSETDSSEEVSSGISPPASTDPVLDMSSLLLQLPMRRGLSNFYNGKSQSFTSLSNARRVQDLEKPENPYNRMLKMQAASMRRRQSQRGETISGGVFKSSRHSCPDVIVIKSKP